MTTNDFPHSSTSRRHDVVVVGARCAGATAAMLLAIAGHDVLLLDRETFPSDSLSTHAIARGGVVQLERWGLLQSVLDTGAPPIRNVEFHSGGADRRADDQAAQRHRHGRRCLGAMCSTRCSSTPPCRPERS